MLFGPLGKGFARLRTPEADRGINLPNLSEVRSRRAPNFVHTLRQQSGQSVNDVVSVRGRRSPPICLGRFFVLVAVPPPDIRSRRLKICDGGEWIQPVRVRTDR